MHRRKPIRGPGKMPKMSNDKTFDYEEAREIAQSDDVSARATLAAHPGVMPEILYFLAADPVPEVRQAIAANSATPQRAHLLLAKDSDDGVRSSLAEKISALAPELTEHERDRVRQNTRETLEILARDQLTQVRQVLSEALKDVAHAPAEVINRLARDEELVVCGPVLEYSPVLTDDDLLDIIQGSPASGGLSAIARRVEVAADVSDAIAATDDIDAIATLISNESAQIREETLDTLVERAEGVELWHAPLVARPTISASAATRLAHFVADNLLEVMQSREDLDEDVLNQVREVVHTRLKGDPAAPGGSQVLGGNAELQNINPPIEMAIRLKEAGKLDPPVIAKALQASDHAFVLASICALADLSEQVAKAIFLSRNGKGVMAVAWKAGLAASMGVHLQQRLARIAPAEVVQTTPEGRYPMSDEDMQWQIDYFTDLAGKQQG